MDFVDWRKAPPDTKTDTASTKRETPKWRGRQYHDYIEELIHEAEMRGEFTNLPGMGKPLQIEDYSGAGERALGYRLLKDNGYAPPEIELVKEIDFMRERVETRLIHVKHQSKTLRGRRFQPSAHEKRAFNAAVEQAANSYEETLRAINSKILTLNISTPTALHRPTLIVEQLVKQFHESCPLFII